MLRIDKTFVVVLTTIEIIIVYVGFLFVNVTFLLVGRDETIFGLLVI